MKSSKRFICQMALTILVAVLGVEQAHAMGFAGKGVLITGGIQGIGAAVARKFADQGARVVVTSRDPNRLTQAIEGFQREGRGQIFGVIGGFGSKAEARNLYREASEAVGGIDILINNAGSWEPANFLEISEEQLDSNLSILKGTFFLTQAIAQDWSAENKEGVVVNIGSASVGRPQVASPCLPHVFQKAGLHEMSKALAVELAQSKIRSNTISLGTVGDEQYQAQLPAAVMGLYPMGRIGRFEEVAETVLFLADGGKSGWMTGADIHMDGGQHASR